MSAFSTLFPLIQVSPIGSPSWSLLSAADFFCGAAVLLLFQRTLAAHGMTRLCQVLLLLLALGQAGLFLALGSARGLGVLLMGVYLLGFGLTRLERGPPEQAYLALALAMPLLALFGAFGVALTLSSFPAALILRHSDDRESFTADVLLAGFPLACTLLALAFLAWMATGKLTVFLPQGASAITSESHAWAQLMGGRFIAPFFVLALLLLIAAPAQIAKHARAIRMFSLSIASAGAFASLLDALPSPEPALILGTVIALLVCTTATAARKPARATLGLAVATVGGWLLVFLGSPHDAARDAPIHASNASLTGMLAPASRVGTWGIREAFARAHPGRVPRLERQGAEFVYVLDE